MVDFRPTPAIHDIQPPFDAMRIRRLLLPLLLFVPAASCDSPTIGPGGPQLSFRVETLSERWGIATPQHESDSNRLTITGGVSGVCDIDGTVEGDSTQLTLRVTYTSGGSCGHSKYVARITNIENGWYNLSVYHAHQLMTAGRVRVR